MKRSHIEKYFSYDEHTVLAKDITFTPFSPFSQHTVEEKKGQRKGSDNMVF